MFFRTTRNVYDGTEIDRFSFSVCYNHPNVLRQVYNILCSLIAVEKAILLSPDSSVQDNVNYKQLSRHTASKQTEHNGSTCMIYKSEKCKLQGIYDLKLRLQSRAKILELFCSEYLELASRKYSFPTGTNTEIQEDEISLSSQFSPT